jgi:pilus biogenesis lipoprotein CpaD
MAMTFTRNALLLGASLMVTAACAPGQDMHGQDPNAFYNANPIKNKVETRSQSHSVFFPEGHARLASQEIDALFAGLADVSPMAVESVQIQLHPSQMHNDARRTHLVKLLRSRGYAAKHIMFEPMKDVDRNGARIDVSYAAVVLPRCPDWRTSPVTNYSNVLNPSNFGCASQVNLGLMVADPRDLEYGTGDGMPDTQRTIKVIEDYRSGTSAATSDSSATSATSTQ